MINRSRKDVRYLVAGDSCLTVEFGNEISMEINQRIRMLTEQLDKKPIQGVLELVPTFRSIMIYYDPCRISYKRLVWKVKALLMNKKTADEEKKNCIEIPVCYSPNFGEDLNDVAEHAGITAEEVVKLHSQKEYLIYMMGFLPGFAYLGGLDPVLNTPRLDNPRTKIPIGAVGIGGEQTGIYPLASPGGWRLIGRTPVKPYDPARENPILYRAGDYIRFKPISEDEFYQIQELAEKQEYTCKIVRRGESYGD